MAMFQDNTKVIGEFQEREYKKYFQVALADPNSWGALHGFKHIISVGVLGEKRFANIKKTVATVCIDESEDGNPIVENWKIKLLYMVDNQS